MTTGATEVATGATFRQLSKAEEKNAGKMRMSEDFIVGGFTQLVNLAGLQIE